MDIAKGNNNLKLINHIPMEIQGKESTNSDIDITEKYVFRLFISKKSPDSLYVVKNIQKFCNQYLHENYELEVVDIYEKPDLVIEEQIILTPLLIKKYPLPEERISGDLNNSQAILSQFHID